MKPKVEVWKSKQDSPENDVPEARKQLRDHLIYTVTELMNAHGIKRIDTGYNLDRLWEPPRPFYCNADNSDERPKEITDIIPLIVKNMSQIMAMYGIVSVELQTGEGETPYDWSKNHVEMDLSDSLPDMGDGHA